jgi:hypothetical protein
MLRGDWFAQRLRRARKRDWQAPVIGCRAVCGGVPIAVVGCGVVLQFLCPRSKVLLQLLHSLIPVALQLDAFNTKLVVDHYHAVGICGRPAAEQIAGGAAELRNSLANFFVRKPELTELNKVCVLTSMDCFLGNGSGLGRSGNLIRIGPASVKQPISAALEADLNFYFSLTLQWRVANMAMDRYFFRHDLPPELY